MTRGLLPPTGKKMKRPLLQGGWGSIQTNGHGAANAAGFGWRNGG
jgi:hypothetical protein